MLFISDTKSITQHDKLTTLILSYTQPPPFSRFRSTIQEYVAEKPATLLTVGQIEKAIAAAKLMKRYEETKSSVPVQFVVDQYEQIALIEEIAAREKVVAAGIKRLSQLGVKPTKTPAEIAEDAKVASDRNKTAVLDASTLLMFNVASRDLSTDYADKFTDERYVASQFGGKHALSSAKVMAYICNPHTMLRTEPGASFEQTNKYASMGLKEIIPALEELKSDVKSAVKFKAVHAQQSESK